MIAVLFIIGFVICFLLFNYKSPQEKERAKKEAQMMYDYMKRIYISPPIKRIISKDTSRLDEVNAEYHKKKSEFEKS